MNYEFRELVSELRLIIINDKWTQRDVYIHYGIPLEQIFVVLQFYE